MKWAKDIALALGGAIVGAAISWAIAYRDTQTQIRGLEQANEKLESLLIEVAAIDRYVHLNRDARGHVVGGYVGSGHPTEGNDASHGRGGTAQIAPQI